MNRWPVRLILTVVSGTKETSRQGGGIAFQDSPLPWRRGLAAFGQRAGEDVVENAERSGAAGGLRAGLAAQRERRRHDNRAGSQFR